MEALRVPLEEALDLRVRGHSHIYLLLVVKQALLVGLVDRAGWWAVEPSAMLVSQLSVLLFLRINCLLADVEHISVHLLKVLRPRDGLREVLAGALLLELFNLRPDVIRNVRGGGNRVKDVGQAELLKEALHLLFLLGDLGELSLHDGLEDVLEFVLERADRRWNHMTQFFIDFRPGVDFFSHGGQGGEVLWVYRWELFNWHARLVVNLFIIISGLGEHVLRLLEFSCKISEVGTSASLRERLGLSELLDADCHVRYSFIHATALILGLLVLGGAKLPVGLSQEVLAVVSEHVSHLTVVVGAQGRVHLVVIKGFLEVEGDLRGDLREDTSVHTGIRGFLEEKVLGLGQAQITVLCECLLVEITRMRIRWQLGDH